MFLPREVKISELTSNVYHAWRSQCVNLKGRDSDTTGDAVKITLAARGDAATTLSILLHDADGFELLEHGTGDRARADLVVVAASPSVAGTAVRLAERTHTHVALRVELASDGGGANVEPIRVIRRELLVRRGLDGVDPSRHFHLLS